jgi:hypothetical protein
MTALAFLVDHAAVLLLAAWILAGLCVAFLVGRAVALADLREGRR